MKPIYFLFAFPAFALAGQISGTVSDLSGAPISGVVVAGSAESDVSKPSGSWILGRVSGIGAKSIAPVRVSTNLVIQNGRPRLSWAGHGLDGRTMASSNLGAPNLVVARTARSASPETLWVYWKGKRLAQVPVESSDTSGVAIRIDTAWNDDFGIPWNPNIKYGSLRDERDGRVYRTVKMGDQAWMAENLTYSGALEQLDSFGVCRGGSLDSCLKYGRQYGWSEVIDSDTESAYEIAYSTTPHQGNCPKGWSLPRESDWDSLVASILPRNSIRRMKFFTNMGGRTGITEWFQQLRASQGWPGGAAEDPYGFRVLPSGIGAGSDRKSIGWYYRDSIAGFWSSNNLEVTGPGDPDPISIFALGIDWGAIYALESGKFNSVRCVQTGSGE